MQATCAMSDRQNEIINMDPVVFAGYLTTGLTKEMYEEYQRYCKTASKSKNNHAVASRNSVLQTISSNAQESTLQLKLRELAEVINNNDYFQELVEAGFADEAIAYTFDTTISNVQCKKLLDKAAEQFKTTKTTQYTK